MQVAEHDYLKIYKEQIEQQLDWGTGSIWTDQDFEKLSELIFDKTNITLSITTLKRIWGKVKYESTPTVTTLNTLAQYSGYENWRSFRSANETKKNDGDLSVTYRDPEKNYRDFTSPQGKNSAFRKHKLPIPWLVVGAVGITLLLFLIFSFLNSASPDSSKVIFTSRQVSNEQPNSVVFNFDAGNNKTDSVTIQQSWDPRRKEKVSALEHQHTSIYYYPGFFKAKLIINNTILKENDILIKTNGWK